MLANSILTATAIALAAGLGSASAGERFVPLEGIAAQALGSTEVVVVTPVHWRSVSRKNGTEREIRPTTDAIHGLKCYALGPPSTSSSNDEFPNSFCNI
jgi:hypothetical protein